MKVIVVAWLMLSVVMYFGVRSDPDFDPETNPCPVYGMDFQNQVGTGYGCP